MGRLETTVQLVGATELPVLDPLGTTGYDMHVPEYRPVDEAHHSEVEAQQPVCFQLFDASDQATQTTISFPPCCFVTAGMAAADVMDTEPTPAKSILCNQVPGNDGVPVQTATDVVDTEFTVSVRIADDVTIANTSIELAESGLRAPTANQAVSAHTNYDDNQPFDATPFVNAVGGGFASWPARCCAWSVVPR